MRNRGDAKRRRRHVGVSDATAALVEGKQESSNMLSALSCNEYFEEATACGHRAFRREDSSVSVTLKCQRKSHWPKGTVQSHAIPGTSVWHADRGMIESILAHSKQACTVRSFSHIQHYLKCSKTDAEVIPEWLSNLVHFMGTVILPRVACCSCKRSKWSVDLIVILHCPPLHNIMPSPTTICQKVVLLKGWSSTIVMTPFFSPIFCAKYCAGSAGLYSLIAYGFGRHRGVPIHTRMSRSVAILQ